jgi:hypothetical protein
MAQDTQAGTTRAGKSAGEEDRQREIVIGRSDGTAQPAADDRVRRVGRRRAAGPARSRLAANDDSPSIGGLIYALNQKPSNKPFVVAAAGSAGWALVSILLGSALLAPDIARSAGFWDALAKPAVLATVATVGVPIALFWFIAYLAWRAESLRLVSSAMTEVAVRLAEPDRLAEQGIASLGQSVRRQVAAMNDAISRAIGRAGELEALVHSEVAALERSYSENEHRIRSLIDELASERNALANNSDRVTDTLRGIGAEVSRDIAVASDEAARNLAHAGARISDQLASQSEQVADLLSEKGNSLFASLSVMNQRIGSEVPALLERLGSEQTRLTRIVEGAAKNLTALDVALAERVGELDTSLGARTGELQSIIGERTARLESVLQAYTEAIDQRIAEQTQSFEETVGARTRSLTERLHQFEEGFEDTARRMESAVMERSEALDAALIERTKAIDTAFAERLRSIEDGISDGANAIDQAVAGRADMLRQAMQDHASALSTVLTRQASDIDATLVQGIQAVRNASETITNQSIQTIGGLSMQSKMLKDVSEGLIEQIHDLTRRFELQNRSMMAVVSTIETAQGRLGTDIDARSREIERIRAETEASTDRALDDIRSRFSAVSRGVSEQLDTLSATTRDVEARSQRLPDAVRSSSETMRRAVQDQLRAIEAISGVAREAQVMRDVSPAQGQSLPSLARSFERETRREGQRPPQRQQQSQEGSERVPPSARARPPRAEQPAAPAGSELGGLRETSWSLGDLLKRASLEDEDGAQSGIEGMMAPQQQPLPSTEAEATADLPPPPRALSMEDMAQAIDAATAAEIWSRRRSGETGLFTRQIYTRSGLQTYEEIIRRLDTDKGFRSMAERYLADFERLLREADSRDPTGRMATAQVAGEMGRVFLLFGHAIGRLV